MPLPDKSDQPWPPAEHQAIARQHQTWAAWWSGDVAKLGNLSPERTFWRRRAEAEARERQQSRAMHAAVAADIVTTSADLLFGEPIDLVIPEPEVTGEESATEDHAETQAEADAREVTQARLNELRDDIDLDGKLLVSAEIAAGMGGVWLRPVWDRTLADHPLLTVIEPSQAVPEYRLGGHLVAVTFWEVVGKETGDVVWRHLERHETYVEDGVRRGVILHGLYRGSSDRLGKQETLTAHEATANLEPLVPVPDGVSPLIPRYMPNVLPNRQFRTVPIGRADFDGVEPELDSIDETWSALMRDVRMGVARVFAREGTLERVAPGAGTGRTFNVDRELIVETEQDPDAAGAPVSLIQAAIRQADHLAIVRALVEQAVSAAGYSPQTFGLDVDGQAESGTALNVRERKTFRTLGKKRRNAARAVAEVLEVLLQLDAALFDRQIVPVRPRVGWPDLTSDQKTTAEWVQLLRTAQAMSIESAVRAAQPDLTDPEVEEEVARIMAESQLAEPDTFGSDQPTDPEAVDPEADPIDDGAAA